MKLSLNCILVILAFSIAGSAQNPSYHEVPANEKAIPKVVKEAFNTQYPKVNVRGWFVTHISYWYADYGPSWYGDWYGPRQVVIYTYEQPAYFEVEFSQDTEISRAIYIRYGFWFETRTKLRGLPLPVMEALKETKYGEWKWSPHKEKIEAPGMTGPVYRLRVSKGLQSRIIRLDGKGNIIQVKEKRSN